MASLCDLRIDCKPSLKEKEKLFILQRCMEMGWDALAWTLTHVGSVHSKTFSAAQHSLVQPVQLTDVRQIKDAARRRALVDAVPPSAMKQYSRLNLIIDEIVDCNSLTSGNEALNKFDIISVTPGNQRVFAQLCRTAHIDMISIDFSHKLQFPLNKKLVDEAVKRGICFEISYAQLLTTQHLRREVVNNVKILVTYLRGKHIVLSSGTDDAHLLRGPLDVQALANVCMSLSVEQCTHALTRGPQNVLLHAASRKRRHVPLELCSAETLYARYPQLLLNSVQDKIKLQECTTAVEQEAPDMDMEGIADLDGSEIDNDSEVLKDDSDDSSRGDASGAEDSDDTTSSCSDQGQRQDEDTAGYDGGVSETISMSGASLSECKFEDGDPGDNFQGGPNNDDDDDNGFLSFTEPRNRAENATIGSWKKSDVQTSSSGKRKLENTGTSAGEDVGNNFKLSGLGPSKKFRDSSEPTCKGLDGQHMGHALASSNIKEPRPGANTRGPAVSNMNRSPGNVKAAGNEKNAQKNNQKIKPKTPNNVASSSKMTLQQQIKNKLMASKFKA
jgi:RNase P/RNase MRP subunit p30